MKRRNINNKILIIGGCGYIGSALYSHLVSKKYNVFTVDLELFGNNINRKNKKNNYNTLPKKFFNQFGVVVLLAGHSSVQMCYTQRLASFKNNVDNFVQLLEKLDGQLFIYASSSTVYGNTKSFHATEEYDRYSPANYYDLTKKVIDYYAQISRIQYFGLRFATVNGASPNLRTDIMINKMYYSKLLKKSIDVSNKSSHRPVLGINDLCRAIERIIVFPADRGIYNLASFNATIGEIAETTSRVLKIPVISKKGTLTYDYSVSTEKFKKMFHFQFTDTIETILASLKTPFSKQIYGERL